MRFLIQDLRFALRTFTRTPGFTVVVLLTLAAGIGATTSMFSIVNGIFLRPLPEIGGQERVVQVWHGEEGRVFSFPTYEEFRDRSDSFTGLAAFGMQGLSLRTEGPAERLMGLLVSPNYFSVLEVGPALGRFFDPGSDTTPGSNPEVVLSHGLWDARFGADPGVIGRTIFLNGHALTVVGVAPRGFTGSLRLLGTDAWVPLSMAEQLGGTPGSLRTNSTWLHVVGRLRPEVSRMQASVELGVLSSQLREEASREHSRPETVAVTPLGDFPSESGVAMLGFTAILLAVSGLVLLIASVNVGSMLLARTLARRREVAVRIALGAGRARLLRQLLTESTLLFLAGGALGILLASWISSLVPRLIPPIDLPIHLDFTTDWRVLGFGVGISFLTGLLFGVAPALHGSDPRIVEELKTGSSTGARRGSRLRSAGMVAQVAGSLVLLVGAGLFVRALQQASVLDPGFRAEGVYTASLDLGIQGYDRERSADFFVSLTERAAALPGVESAAMAWLAPLGMMSANISVAIDGQEAEARGPVSQVPYNVVGPGYFRTLRLPLVAGREFEDYDRMGSQPVAIANRTMAERYWPGEDPIGQVIRRGDTRIEVIGVAANSKFSSLGEEDGPFLYLPQAQEQKREAVLFARTTGDPASLLPLLQAEVQRLDPHVPLLSPAPLERSIRVTLFPQQVAATVTGILGLIGLLLTAVGTYGLVGYATARRTREIGIRMAMGARHQEIVRMVLGQGVRLALVGGVLGLLAAFALMRLLTSLLYGISPTDPATLVTVVALLGGMTLLASYIPARRAAGVDPMVALRAD